MLRPQARLAAPKNKNDHPKRSICALTFAGVVVLLGGCASTDWHSARENKTSGIAIPSAWAATAKTGTPSSATLASWWRQFDDAQLDTLITDALHASPDVRSAQAKLRQSRASHDLAVANQYPSLGVSASANRSQSGTAAGGSGSARSVYAAGFDASWEPSIFGGLSDAADAAQADTAATAATLEATRASLAAEVALNYVNLRAAQQRLSIARDNVTSQQETLQIVQWRAQAGLVGELDVEQARTNLAQSRASIPSLETARANAGNRLAVLTGQAPGSAYKDIREQAAASASLPTPPENIAVGIPADTLRQRPDVQAAGFSLQAEMARSAQQEAARYPSLQLSGTWGWQAFSIAALGGGGSLVGSVAGSLAANLFDGGRIKSRIAVQNAVEEQALIAYEKTVLTALEDVENALTAYAAGRERVDARSDAADAARKAAALARTLYQAGSTDFASVLETERSRLSSEDALASARADVLTAVIQLYKALGGGWTAQNPQGSSDDRSDDRSYTSMTEKQS